MVLVTFQIVDKRTGLTTDHDGFELPVLPRIGEGVLFDGDVKMVLEVIHDIDQPEKQNAFVRIK